MTTPAASQLPTGYVIHCCSKQRSIAEDLRTHIEAARWDEVARSVKIINGLSAMIRDDAQQILLSALQGAAGAVAGPKDERLLS